jgi:hypothetical protein
MLPILASLLSGIGGKILGNAAATACDVVDQLVADKDLAVKLKHDLNIRVLEIDTAEYTSQIEAQRSVLLGEIQGESWMQRNWRPTVMLMFAAIIANNFIIFPYLSLFDATNDYVTQLELPSYMWECLKLGLTGYIVGRSAEKISQGTGLKGIAGKVLHGGND